MPHVTMITLGARDLPALEAYYVALGWRRSEESIDGRVSFLRGGAVVLGLFGADALAEEAGVAPGAGARVSLSMNVTSTEEVDAALSAATAAGGTVTAPARAMAWGGYSGYVTDPEGHLWEISHNPFWPLDADGAATLSDD